MPNRQRKQAVSGTRCNIDELRWTGAPTPPQLFDPSAYFDIPMFGPSLLLLWRLGYTAPSCLTQSVSLLIHRETPFLAKPVFLVDFRLSLSTYLSPVTINIGLTVKRSLVGDILIILGSDNPSYHAWRLLSKAEDLLVVRG